MKFKLILPVLISLTLTHCTSKTQETNHIVRLVGEMKNVMWKGQLAGQINLDTIANKTNLYGLGPIEYLAGELLILNGVTYQSTIVSDTSMKVEKTSTVKAPFFAYATVSNWKEQFLADSIQTLKQLEHNLDQLTANYQRPFIFKLSGTVDQATIHVVNLPKGSRVSSPDEAHAGQKNFELRNEPSEIIGFFSTSHQAIFTHHDTFLHLHLITTDYKKMGHVDKVLFKKGTMRLYLPSELTKPSVGMK